MKGKALDSRAPKSSADRRKLPSVLASIETIIKHSAVPLVKVMGVLVMSGGECPFWTSHSH